jgi:hypothetical protein
MLTASIIKAMMMMEAASMSETSVNSYQTSRCKNTEVIFIFATMKT